MNRRDIRKKILWDVFVKANRFLRDLEVDYWVNYGTLLGFYRDGGIIDEDIDIDFGCEEKYYEIIKDNRERLDPDLTMHDTSARHNGPKLYFSYKGFDADIYFYRTVEGRLQSLEKTGWENYNKPIPEDLVFPTMEYEIDDVKTRAPGRIEEYLKFIYGNISKGAARNSKTGYWE